MGFHEIDLSLLSALSGRCVTGSLAHFSVILGKVVGLTNGEWENEFAPKDCGEAAPPPRAQQAYKLKFKAPIAADVTVVITIIPR